MEITEKQRVEILKKSFAVWPNITVRDTGMLSDGLAIKVRCVLTLLRLKKDGIWKLIEVRYDMAMPTEDEEMAWVEGMHTFLNQVSLMLRFWDGETGIIDDNQKN